jgi:rubrerythrin
MVAMIGHDDALADLLEDLIRLEYDTLAAYEDAITRLREADLRSALGIFNEHHLCHLREFGALLAALGRTPPQHGDARRFLARGKVALGGLIGDTAVLHAMRSNEEQTSAAYERALRFDSLPPQTRALLEQALGHERQHCEWLGGKLGKP